MACVNPNNPDYKVLLEKINNPLLAEIEFNRQSEVSAEKAMPMIKELVKRMGVDIKTLQEISVNGVKQNVNGVANIMQKIIQVVEGKEAQALPEEAMHFVVAIIKQTNPTLYRKLLSEINDYRILNDVFRDYGNDYLTKDGKPDVIKLKEEAIAKVLSEIIIGKVEGTQETPERTVRVQNWWNQIIDFIKSLFVKSGFDRAAMDIISGKAIGTAEDAREAHDAAFLQKDNQTIIFDKLDEVSSKIELKDNTYYINGKKIARRVSDLVKDWYTRRFNDKDLTKSEFSKAVDDLKKEKGTAGHADFQHAMSVFVDEKGFVREEELDDDNYTSQLNSTDRSMYEILKANLKERIHSFPAGTRFKSEITIYDAKRDIAGTIDFLAITPDGKINILDWKFMDLNVNKYKDVPWYKVTAWRNQMDQYKLILQTSYGAKSEDFQQTRMIPIQAVYTEGSAKLNVLPTLKSVKIGDVNVKNIKEDYLLPVGLEAEKTGNRKIDALIEKLNAVYKKFSERKVLPSEKEAKAEQLNELFKSIRQLQIKGNLVPLVRQSKILNKQIHKTIETYNTKFKGKDPRSFSIKEINDFADEIQTSQNAVATYVSLDIDLRSLFEGELSDEDKKLREDLRDTADDARDLQSTLNDVLNDYASDIIAKNEGVEGLLLPEKIIKGITKYFASTSTLQLKSISYIYRAANRAFALAGMDTLDENKKLEELKHKYEEWAKARDLGKKNIFNIIKKKGSNELIDEFNREFYTTLKSKIEEKDYKWVRDNINIPEYNEFLKERLKLEIDRIEDKHRVGTAEEIAREIEREKANARALYNTSTSDSPGWLLYDYVLRFPQEKWQSAEWKELIKPENKAAKDFYDYIRERNKIYKELGYINRGDARTFLPFIRKSLMEKLVVGGNIRLGEQFFKSISIDEGDIGYGKVDPLTGKPIDIIPKYFTQAFDDDYSEDLFKTMSLYNEAAIRYKYLSEIENSVRAITTVERNKKAIATSMFGKTQYKDGKLEYNPDNNENSKLVEDTMKSIIYGQRYLTSETFDQLLGKIGNWGKMFNEKLGMKIFPEDIGDRQVSVNKMIDQFNNMFQLNALGLNILSAGSNLFGGNMQSLINSGRFFTKTDYLAAQGMIFMNKFAGTDRKKLLGALEYFLPLTENYNREVAKKLSLSTLTSESLQDGLMFLMRQSDWNVQTANFYAYLKNTIVDGDRIVNVREYLRSQPKYSERYAGTAEKRKALNDDFENEVKKLIEEKGVLKLAQVVDNQFVIPGVDRHSDSVIELRRMIQQLTHNSLGNMSEDNIRMITRNVYGKSFMVFKNWIPRLVDVRTGNLKYNSASDAYEWGRMRMIFRVISEDLLGSLGNLRNSLIANDKGIEFMRQLYEKKKADYENDTGKTLEMDETIFMDLVRQNIKSQMTDVLFLTILLSLIVGLKAAAPDDDEDPDIISQYRFMQRAADKFKSELMYFYNPSSLLGTISGSIFPSIGLIENFSKFTKNFFIENWALATGDEELADKTKVIKYWMKSFPFTNQMIGYLPMFYPELAKDLGVRINANYGIR